MNIAVDLTSMEECLYKLKNCVHKVRKVYWGERFHRHWILIHFIFTSVGCSVSSPPKHFAFLKGSQMEVLSPRFGEDAVFKCETNDASSNVTLWHRQNPFVMERMISLHVGQHSSTPFTVRIANSADGGLYTCKAANVRGEDIVKPFLVVIDTRKYGGILRAWSITWESHMFCVLRDSIFCNYLT